MARTALREKAKRTPKYSSRAYHRCELCGRSRSVYRKFRVCRLCLRRLASEGKVPGVVKSSW